MTSQASLSLSLLLTKVTHAQYRKRFRASYNTRKTKGRTSTRKVGGRHTAKPAIYDHCLVQRRAVVKTSWSFNTGSHWWRRTCPCKSQYGIEIYRNETKLMWLTLEKKTFFEKLIIPSVYNHRNWKKNVLYRSSEGQKSKTFEVVGEWTSTCKISQLWVAFSRWSLTPGKFLYKTVHAWNFGHKGQVVAEFRDRKWQALLYFFFFF